MSGTLRQTGVVASSTVARRKIIRLNCRSLHLLRSLQFLDRCEFLLPSPVRPKDILDQHDDQIVGLFGSNFNM